MNKMPWRVEWSDALSMSNPEIDAEHQHFIRLVNELNDEMMSQQRDKAAVERILNLILEDAIAHFAHEEQLFIEKGFPGAREHADIHAKLIDKFRKILTKIQNTDFNMEWTEAGLEIKNLLVSHVLNEDSKYIEYLRTE